MDRGTLRSALGLQDHQTCPDQRNPILTDIQNGSDHPGQHQHADILSGRGDLRPEQCPAPTDAGSLRGKAIKSPNLHFGLSNTNPGCSSQEGEVLGIPSQRLGPEASDSEHVIEEIRKAGTHLGGPLHHCHSGR